MWEVRRALPFAGGTALAVAAGITLSAFAGAGPACAQDVPPRLACPAGQAAPPQATVVNRPTAPSCSVANLLRSASVRPAGRGLTVSVRRRRASRVTVSVFQTASTRAVLGERLVFRTTARQSAVRWAGRRQARRATPSDGVFFVRVSARAGSAVDTRRFALRRTRGRFTVLRTFARRDGCADLRSFKVERPAFGGRGSRAVGVSFRIARDARVTVELRRGGRTVRRLTRSARRAGVLHRLRIAPERLPRGRYEVRLRFGTTTASLFVERI
ncbi:MAG: hypothetical protein AVDCRST_MAG85-80 [uncultured Solirubrobacteraceae bacterium]|uniref:Uncharacterized protein n=1 Tax=uncultured Solirubrobacteraceae bacterium TaxID=1162706 RepID=A0A6J4RM46_9ACTN|nr:MAG: hypothetical protein AVDCRST_MAG85-80 [uncultured Solirubrobacteraceae bacterium]